ncbi:MAG: hypothetical protein Q9203_003942 [Teloschistes exilis]
MQFKALTFLAFAATALPTVFGQSCDSSTDATVGHSCSQTEGTQACGSGNKALAVKADNSMVLTIVSIPDLQKIPREFRAISAMAKQMTGEESPAGFQGYSSPAPMTRPPTKDLQKSSVVTIKVGIEPHQHEFTIHTDLLCYYSPFFKKAINSGFAEGKTGVINLPDDEFEVFEIFQNWLYRDNLELTQVEASKMTLLLGLWVFGDKLQVPGFQNAAIEALRDRTVGSPRICRLKDILFAFGNTSPASPLRQFIVDLYVWEGTIGESIEKFLREGYPHDFIVSVVQGYTKQFHRPSAKAVKNNRPYAQSAEKYYTQTPAAVAAPEEVAVITTILPPFDPARPPDWASTM